MTINFASVVPYSYHAFDNILITFCKNQVEGILLSINYDSHLTIKDGIINVYKFPAYLNKPYVTVQISCRSDS